MVASIRRVADFQTRAARSDLEADRAYVEAFGNADLEVVNWASISYNLLELNRPDRIWPPASNALISDVRAFLTEMQADPAKLVSINAKSMLSAIAQRQR